jgi:WS/DGAT/MGAT family acyltransferase
VRPASLEAAQRHGSARIADGDGGLGKKAAVSRKRLTALDASFLEVESRTAHMHVGWAALFAPPEVGPSPTFDDLREHIAARVGRAPRYRQKLTEVPLGVGDPVWIDDPEFDLDRHVRRVPVRDFQKAIDDVLSVPLRRDRPLWELWIADRLDDGRIGTIGKVHHCMVDGIAAVELSTLMLDASPEPPPERDEWHALRAPAALELATDAIAARAAQAARLARLPLRVARRPALGIDTAARVLRAARSSLRPARPTPLNDAISSRRHLGRVRRPLDQLRAVKREHGATINDVLLAAAAGGLRRILLARGEQPVPVKAMVPVSVRDDQGGELGNRISFVFVDVPCDEPDPEVRLARVIETMVACKAGGEPQGGDLLLGALEYAPRPLQHLAAHLVASPRTFNLVVSNIPGPPLPLYMRGCRLEEAYPVVPLADNHGVAIGMTSIAGEACFGIYAAAESVPDADALANAIAESVDELTTPTPVGIA